MRLATKSSRSALISLCVGACLLVGVPVGLALSSSRINAGSLPGPPAGRSSGRVAGPVGREHSTSLYPDPLAVVIPVRSARLRDVDRQGQAGPKPVEVSVPAVDLRARVSSVGIAPPGGVVQVPSDVRMVGWYRFGPSPGQPGSALLVGHVDSRVQGKGAFFSLARIRIGAAVWVRMDNGRVLRFRVVARRAYPKGRLPARIFDRDGPSVVTLVTCGGSFDARLRTYADNVVLFAVPA